jgi:hypothetical protein
MLNYGSAAASGRRLVACAATRSTRAARTASFNGLRVHRRPPARPVDVHGSVIDISRRHRLLHLRPLLSAEVIIAIGTTADAVYVRSRILARAGR